MRRTLAAVALVVAVAGTARAEDRKLAERYFRLGEKAYQAQNFEAAAQNFEEAYKHFELAEIAFSAAQAYRRQYRIDPKPEYVALAVKHYRAYLEKRKSGGRVADAADALAEMQQELERLIKSGVKVSEQLARDYTSISINPALDKQASRSGMQEVSESTTDVATKIVVKLDGTQVEPFAPINVDPGEHKIRVAAEGYVTQDKVATVQQGANKIVDVELVAKPARVTVKTEDGAHIVVDGRPQPTTTFELPAGRHVIAVTHRGRNAVAREVMLQRGQELTLREPLEKTTRRTLVPWLLVGSGAALAFAGLNVGLALREDGRASDILDDINATGNQTSESLAAYDHARTWRTRYAIAAWTSGAAFVGLAGIAALLYYTDNPSPDGVRVEPVILSGGGGAAIGGRF